MYTEDDIVKMVDTLINNIFVKFWWVFSANYSSFQWEQIV
jgi:hypothetical protein